MYWRPVDRDRRILVEDNSVVLLEGSLYLAFHEGSLASKEFPKWKDIERGLCMGEEGHRMCIREVHLSLEVHSNWELQLSREVYSSRELDLKREV